MWGPIIAAGLQAGGGLLGGMFGSQGQSATNAAQIAAAQGSQMAAQEFSADRSDTQMKWQTDRMYDQFAFSGQEAEKARDWQWAAAQHQMDFQADMSNTAYRRQMQDMRMAGLNPILAAGQGGGASSPSGAMGSGPAASGGSAGSGSAPSGSPNVPHLGNPGEYWAKGLHTAAQAAQVYQQWKQTAADISLKDANTSLTGASEERAKQETQTSKSQQDQNEALTVRQKIQAINDAIDTKIKLHEVNSAAATARIREREASDAERYGSGPYGAIAGNVQRMIDTLIGKFGGAKDVPSAPNPPNKGPFADDKGNLHWPGPRN